MSGPHLRSATTKSAILALVLGGLLIAATSPAAESDRPAAPRSSDGRPDLEGVWDFRTLTPLERPKDTVEKAQLTENEVVEIETKAAARTQEQDRPSDPDRGAPPEGAGVGSYNSFWYDQGALVSEDRRTSRIVDPPNGRLPAVHPGVKRQMLGDDLPPDLPVRLRVGGIGSYGPESRGLAERCLLGFNIGPPIMPGGYNQNIRIVQTKDHLMILNEMVHEARIVPIDGRGRVPMHIRPWTGSSLGHWDGDTLVVDTVNFKDELSSFSATVFAAVGSAKHMRLTKRFRRLDEGTLHYEFTVDDPATYSRPFTAVMLMKETGQRVFEYACHEGNYGMRNMLSGARAQEKMTAESN